MSYLSRIGAAIKRALSTDPLDDEYRAMQLVARIDQLVKDQGGSAEFMWHDGETVRLTVTIPSDLHARALLHFED